MFVVLKLCSIRVKKFWANIWNCIGVTILLVWSVLSQAGESTFILFACSLCVYIIDPYFHYRRPQNELIYGVNVSERYINDGIAKNFDIYANWNNNFKYGKETVLSSYERLVKSRRGVCLSAEERNIIKANIEQNVIEIATEYPHTCFILFLRYIAYVTGIPFRKTMYYRRT